MEKWEFLGQLSWLFVIAQKIKVVVDGWWKGDDRHSLGGGVAYGYSSMVIKPIEEEGSK